MTFRERLNQIAETYLGEWSTTEIDISPAAIVRGVLYASLLGTPAGCSSEVNLTPQVTVEEERNGKIIRTTYPSGEYQLRRETDFDKDGTPETIETSTHDKEGNWLTSDYDADGDGVLDGPLDLINRWEYDSKGRETRHVSRLGIDGGWRAIHTKAYDSQGRIVRRTFDTCPNGGYSDTSTPCVADGDLETIETWEYGVEGGWQFTRNIRANGDGVPRAIWILEYNPGLRINIRTLDEDGDGTADESTLTHYDEHGRPIKRIYDRGVDGEQDYVWEGERDDEGNIRRETRDLNGDGKPDLVRELKSKWDISNWKSVKE